MSELPKIKRGRKTYYFDERLKQLRNVKIMDDFHPPKGKASLGDCGREIENIARHKVIYARLPYTLFRLYIYPILILT